MEKLEASRCPDQIMRFRVRIHWRWNLAHDCMELYCTVPSVIILPLSQYDKYRIYPKYSDTSTPHHICSKIWTSTIHYPMLCLKIAGWVANSVDPDETPQNAASHLGLNCLLRPVCPNTYGKYGNVERNIKHQILIIMGKWNWSNIYCHICFALVVA